jgi:hypothetical protein
MIKWCIGTKLMWVRVPAFEDQGSSNERPGGGGSRGQGASFKYDIEQAKQVQLWVID